MYSSILKSEWAIHPDAWNSYSIFLRHLVNGTLDSVIPQEELSTDMVISYIDSDGNSYRSSEDRPVEDGSIVVVSLMGVMTKYGGICHYGTSEIANFLAINLNRNEVIGAIILEDTGGGASNSIAPLINVINNRKKPIVTLADTAASAGYWTAASTDFIIADNNISAGFGSIGVVIGLMDIQPKLEAEGIKFHKVYAPESEHKNEAFELLLQGKYDLIKKEMLSPLAIRFQDYVKDARGSKLKADYSGVLTGRMFFAEEALELGMIDAIGDMNLAISKVKDLAEVYELKTALS